MTEDEAWVSKTVLIKSFFDQKTDYEKLAEEVSYILEKRINDAGIDISNISFRAKTLESFLQKIERKTYKAPLEDITDFAGVRVVTLYLHNNEEIDKIIKQEFKIIEKVDKYSVLEVDQFGYGAIHYVVQLGKKSSGARYDDLKDRLCEIQVRTVLQDAWAVVQHHMIYKNESDIPKPLQRKINGLAALFETADDQFQSVYKKRLSYADNVKSSQSDLDEFLSTEINIDSLTSYASWKFPEKSIEEFPGRIASINSLLKIEGAETLADVEAILNKSSDFRDFAFINEDKKSNRERISASVELARALAFCSESVRNSGEISERWVNIANTFLEEND